MRRPGFLAIFLTLSALAVTLFLGTWQLQRLDWKNQLVANVQAGLAAAPVDLAAHMTAPTADPIAGLGALAYQPVTVRGIFLHELETHITPRAYKGTSGLHVITPLRLAGGEIILVNRGWIPNDRRDPARRNQGQVVGPVIINGILRAGFEQGYWTPDHDARADLWFWYDIAGMAKARGLDLPSAVVLANKAANPGGLPVGGVALPALRNDHLNYALTWYALAIIVAVIFLLAHRRKDP